MIEDQKSEDQLRLEYNSTLASVSAWPIRWQKKLMEAIRIPSSRGGENISEIST